MSVARAFSTHALVASVVLRGTHTRAHALTLRHSPGTALSTTACFNGKRTPSASRGTVRRFVARAAAGEAPIVSPFVENDDAKTLAKEKKTKYDELTKENVEEVLDTIRPYLIKDGGNIEVVTVGPNGILALKLQGACGSCESSQATMKNGVEKVLFESFGDLLKEVQEVRDGIPGATVGYVNQFLEKLRPAIANYGGTVECTSIESKVCYIKYKGPEMIAPGIRDAVKEKFEDLESVVVLIVPPKKD